MKRILTILAAVTILVTGLSAQTRAFATLSHDGQLTFFDSVTSLEDAIEAAIDGDIIYLNDGKFGTTNTEIRIYNKKISIIGNGYSTHILPSMIFIADSNNIELTAPLFDGVKMESISFSNINSSYWNNVEIKKSYIKLIDVGSSQNMKLDRCYIDFYRGANAKSNVQILNSKINQLYGFGETIQNCNIKEVLGDSGIILNSVIGTIAFNALLIAIHQNCLFGGNEERINNYLFENCYLIPETVSTDLFDDNLECIIDLSDYKGTDGSVIGIYGGEWFPYSETPSVPTVDSANSSVEYDKDANKLNVKISVTPN